MYHVLVENLSNVDHLQESGNLEYKRFRKFAKKLKRSSAVVSSGRRGNNIAMHMIGATVGTTATPKMLVKDSSTNQEKEEKMLRPNVPARIGNKGQKIQQDDWYSKLVTHISDVTLDYVERLSRTKPYYKNLLLKLLYVKNNFPPELRICNSIFTSQILLTAKDIQAIMEMYPHFDLNDIIGAVLIIGRTLQGGEFHFYKESKYLHKRDKDKVNLEPVFTIPFSSGTLVIAPFDRILHAISKWDGELFFLNLHTSRDVVEHPHKFGWKAYNTYASMGFPQGFFKIPNYD